MASTSPLLSSVASTEAGETTDTAAVVGAAAPDCLTDDEVGGPRRIEAVLTCEGNIDDPDFPDRRQRLFGKLEKVLSNGKS